MANFVTHSGYMGSIMKHEFTEFKQLNFLSETKLNKTFLTIDRNKKNEIIKITLPWTFFLYNGDSNVYSVRHDTVLEIDESSGKITTEQLTNVLTSSYAKLYKDVDNDSLLKYALSSIQDFSPNSTQSEQNIQSALKYLSNILSL